MSRAQKCATTAPVFTFSFALWPQVEDGATVASATVTATPTGLTIGTPSVSGSDVKVSIGGGTAGVTYTLDCHVTLSDGQTDCQRQTLYVY